MEIIHLLHNNLWKYTYEQGICKVVFSMADTETILNTFIYDDQMGMTIVPTNAGTVGTVDRM